MEAYESTTLWKNAFGPKKDDYDESRAQLASAFWEFRVRVVLLLQQIQSELPSLTLHDITHVDSLWRVASEIAGPDYDLNPAEAFVLGGAFLLHDAAHCRAAFPGGLKQLQETTEWQDALAQRALTSDALIEGSEPYQAVLFDTLRVLHPKQARKLPFAYWPTGSDGSILHLFPHDDLREAYGHLIGEIAESHWWHPHELEPLARRNPTAPVCLAPANWTVDMLKVSILLRTADAAHIDAKRAPRFLMVMNQPQGFSKEHWQFQVRLNQPKLDPARCELIFSGNQFPQNELSAWWLAFDAACLANKELASADMLLRDNHRERLAARCVAGVHSPEIFARYVPTNGWFPVDTNIKITDIKTIVERFGGEKLYGEDPSAALRELMQNSVDAVHACRSLGGLGANEGEIEIALEEASGGHWLHVTDTGIGMSRYVLTEVLLDFGRSLWRSADLRGEWSGLSSSGFESIGQFGIGFFSVFMLGERVQIVTRRYENKEGEAPQWLLDFAFGTNKRPTLRTPDANERLKKHGTRVSVLITQEKLQELCTFKQIDWRNTTTQIPFNKACTRLAPSLDMDFYVLDNGKRQLAIKANDWLTLPSLEILHRITPVHFGNENTNKFGPWSHMSELRNENGDIVGRCAVQPYLYHKTFLGIGTVKGLLAGTVNGLAGIVLSKPQSDLARKESIPDVTFTNVQQWAERQKELLIAHRQLNASNSGLLAYFGASYTGLILGCLGGQSISYEEFINAAINLDEIVVHNDEVSYDDEDDEEVLRRDFEDCFIRHYFLLELTSSPLPEWLGKIADGKNSSNSWSLDSAQNLALEKAWGQVKLREGKVSVGSVNGIDITRTCWIAKR